MISEPTSYFNARRSPQGMERPFSRAATQQCSMWLAPLLDSGVEMYFVDRNCKFISNLVELFGRGNKRSSALLIDLEIEWLTLRSSASQLTASCHAGINKLTLLEY